MNAPTSRQDAPLTTHDPAASLLGTPVYDPAGWVTADILSPLVARLLGADVRGIRGWRVERVVTGGGDQLGVWHVTGTAMMRRGGCRDWSMYLKGWPPTRPDATPADWDWPGREAAAYGSGLLATLPGRLDAPRFLGDDTRSDGTTWLWIAALAAEGSAGTDPAPWPLERFARLARALGVMNGAFLAGCPLPDEHWVGREWLRQWVEIAAPSYDAFDAAVDHPLVQRVYSPEVRTVFAAAWARRDELLATLQALPQTFSHLDAFPRNIVVQSDDRYVAIDWGYSGIAAVGEEAAALIAATLFFDEVAPEDAAELETTVLRAYEAGLASAGWDVDARAVRRGYLTAVTMRYGLGTLRGEMFYFLDERNHPRMEAMMGRPMDAIVELFAPLETWVAERAIELLDDAW